MSQRSGTPEQMSFFLDFLFAERRALLEKETEKERERERDCLVFVRLLPLYRLYRLEIENTRAQLELKPSKFKYLCEEFTEF